MEDSLYSQLSEHPKYAQHLYRYGYVVTDDPNFKTGGTYLPTNWNPTSVQNYTFWLHPEQKLFLYTQQNTIFFLIGHAYNPFSMLSDENSQLEALAKAYTAGVDKYCQELSDMTGLFLTGYIADGKLTIYGDATGMFVSYYGFVGGHTWVGSHASLLGDLNHLQQSAYVQELVSYRFYPLFGFSLPGDISPYDAFKRLVPNHSVTLHRGSCHIRRFYPVSDWNELQEQYTPEERAAKAADILGKTLALIPQKWKKPAISLTGGCDSKTTLACASKHYDRYTYFSYISQSSEAVDAEGAQAICNHLGLSHTIYSIPDSPIPDQELAQDIIQASLGNIGKPNMREVQKRIFLSDLCEFDVEVKSWASEIARAYYHKRFAKKRFPAKPTPRYMTTLYKVFAHNRSLVRKTDAVFADYAKVYLWQEDLRNWSWLDLFFWEFRVSAWNGLVITGEHRFSGDITIPYNNRHLLEIMLAIPEQMRIDDTLYKQIRTLANPAVDVAGVQITNLKHTEARAKAERLYLALHSHFPW